MEMISVLRTARDTGLGCHRGVVWGPKDSVLDGIDSSVYVRDPDRKVIAVTHIFLTQ